MVEPALLDMVIPTSIFWIAPSTHFTLSILIHSIDIGRWDLDIRCLVSISQSCLLQVVAQPHGIRTECPAWVEQIPKEV